MSKLQTKPAAIAISKRLFSTDSPKAIKSDEFGYLNAIQYMAPASTSGVNLCSDASPACIALCLGWFSGQAGMLSDAELEHGRNDARNSRIVKAQAFMKNRAAYMAALVRQIENLIKRAAKLGKKLCVRLNGSTDTAWEGLSCWRAGKPHRNLFVAFPEVEFVDYTKNARRFDRALPSNYHLTFSRSETNEAKAIELLARGVNVACVFAGDKPAAWQGFTVIDGDKHDLRQLDPRGHRGFVVALSPKGRKAKRDTSGFVIR
jgi:hypothetical protein